MLAALALGAQAMDYKGQNCGIEKPGHELVQSEAGWKELWKKLGKPAPELDLRKSFAVAVFAGQRPTGGFSIAFEQPKAEKGALVVRYAVRKPKGMALMALTTPYAVKTFEKTGQPVKVEERAP